MGNSQPSVRLPTRVEQTAPATPDATGWAPLDEDITELELSGLAAAIQGRIDEVRGNAASAHEQLHAMRLAHAPGSLSGDDGGNALAIWRLSALAEEVAIAEAAKVAALEAELVSVDGALERLQSGTASQSDFRTHFGSGILRPVETSELRLVHAESPGEIVTLFAPRKTFEKHFHVRRLAVPSGWDTIPEFCILAVDREGIRVLTMGHVSVATFSFTSIAGWDSTPKMFYFEFSDYCIKSNCFIASKAHFDTSRGREIHALMKTIVESLMTEEASCAWQ